MKIIRNFNQFKQNKLNEELTPFAGEIDNQVTPNIEQEEEIEHESDDDFDEEEISDDGYTISDDNLDIDADEEENRLADEQELDFHGKHEDEEEEGGDEYIGQRLMNELGDMLDAPVINNTITYEGRKINFFSETEKFHIDNKQFDTPQEVYDYLMGEGEQPSSDVIDTHTELEEPIVEESKSYRAKALRRKQTK